VATLIIRNVDDETKSRLMRRAAENGRSTEAEGRHILREATKESTWLSTWLALAPGFAGPELEIPSRSEPRGLDLTGKEY
jgi:plasmid stability protein